MFVIYKLCEIFLIFPFGTGYTVFAVLVRFIREIREIRV